jgi:hypothetical protein
MPDEGTAGQFDFGNMHSFIPCGETSKALKAVLPNEWNVSTLCGMGHIQQKSPQGLRRAGFQDFIG